jgi:REP element-mobilizing transposase RayT
VVDFGLAGVGARPTLNAMPANSAILAKYRYRRRLPHIQKAGAELFVTFCTLGRLLLSDAAKSLVLEHCLREAGLRPIPTDGVTRPNRVTRAPSPAKLWKPRIDLHAIVVMPDHVHLLLTPLRDDDGWPYPLVDILQCLKSVTARRINKVMGKTGPVWEEESFDHVLRSDESLEEKREYIRRNAVKAGLVQEPEDYDWLWINPEIAV